MTGTSNKLVILGGGNSPERQIFVLEINTMPGMTKQSSYPKATEAAGIQLPKRVTKFVNMAIKVKKV